MLCNVNGGFGSSAGCEGIHLRYSIVIPTFNRPQMLRRAVKSALVACAVDAEVVVVDDASRQPAAEILRDISDARLRIMQNGNQRGPSGARNFGVTAARGEVVFFLDDDDELIPGYCDRVISGPVAAARAVWGFARIRLRVVGPDGGGTDENVVRRHQNTTGVVADRAPLRAKVAGAGSGFWIRRDTFIGEGGFDQELLVDEDTDLCVRLVTSGRLPWFEAEPGTIVYRNYEVEPGGQQQLTAASLMERAAISCLRTYNKAEASLPPYSEGRWFLATRYIRRSVKAGQSENARDFCRSRAPLPFRMALSAYLALKELSRRTKASEA